MIVFENVTKIYNLKNKESVLALKDVSFKIEDRELVLLVGKSGSGKSTVLKLILGEEKPTSGRILIDNEEVPKMKDGKLSKLRRKIGVVFQDYKLLSQRNVFENVSFVMETTGFSDEEIKKEVPEILEIVGLEKKIYNFPDELSQGEKQKLCIARAIAHRPKILLADEPAGNLDPENTLEILKIFKKINSELKTTVLIATHYQDVVEFFKSRILILKEGRLIYDGPYKKTIILKL
jgi:cell division transport system ATP-binding protein